MTPQLSGRAAHLQACKARVMDSSQGFFSLLDDFIPRSQNFEQIGDEAEDYGALLSPSDLTCQQKHTQ